MEFNYSFTIDLTPSGISFVFFQINWKSVIEVSKRRKVIDCYLGFCNIQYKFIEEQINVRIDMPKYPKYKTFTGKYNTFARKFSIFLNFWIFSTVFLFKYPMIKGGKRGCYRMITPDRKGEEGIVSRGLKYDHEIFE